MQFIRGMGLDALVEALSRLTPSGSHRDWRGSTAEARRWLAVTRDLAADRLRTYDGRDPLGESSWTGAIEHQAVYRWGAKAITGADRPADPREHLYRGRMYARLGDAAKADAEFAAAVAARPDDPEVYALRAAFFDDFGQPDRAKADRAKADGVAGRLRAADVPDAATAAGLATHMLGAFDRAAWSAVKRHDAKSEGGAALAVQPDGSVLACGPSPESDTDTVTSDAPAGPITGPRLECLPDPSLPFGRSGRQPRSGTFDLPGLTVENDGKPVRLTSAAADGAAIGCAPGGVLDGRPETCWCPPAPADRHWLAVAFPEPLSAGGRVTVRVVCRNPKYRRATPGRFRLSVTGVPTDRLAALEAATTAGGWGRLAAAEVLTRGDPGTAAEHLARALDEATPAAARALAPAGSRRTMKSRQPSSSGLRSPPGPGTARPSDSPAFDPGAGRLTLRQPLPTRLSALSPAAAGRA